MKITVNKIFIVLIITIFITGSYLYFAGDGTQNKFVNVALGSSLTDANGAVVDTVNPSTSDEDKINSDISFLTTLVSLKNIRIDTSIFSNSSFNRLKDNTIEIEKVESGRTNPFAPISTNVQGAGSAVSVITNQATQVATKTAVLNGTVNNNPDSSLTNAYFEYGLTANLGTVTEMTQQSLIGTFSKTISNLTPKTTYFFKACLKINNTPVCGEIISLITN